MARLCFPLVKKEDWEEKAGPDSYKRAQLYQALVLLGAGLALPARYCGSPVKHNNSQNTSIWRGHFEDHEGSRQKHSILTSEYKQNVNIF